MCNTRKFFLGNGMSTTDSEKAATDLLHRDHKLIVHFLENYCSGQLGAYFVPSIFISDIPKVISTKQGEYDEKYSDTVKGQIAEKIVFEELQKHLLAPDQFV